MENLNKLNEFLREVDKKLVFLTTELSFDYKKLIEEEPSTAVKRSHPVSHSAIDNHNEKYNLNLQVCEVEDKLFPDHSESGSFIKLNSELLNQILKDVSNNSPGIENDQLVPNFIEYLNRNFTREEKLAVYNFVLANTQKQNLYSDLYLQKTETEVGEKKLSAWELAAAERDAKRRRASYRNKVHTKHKTYTEILRELINVQMELVQEVVTDKSNTTTEKCKSKSRSTGLRKTPDVKMTPIHNLQQRRKRENEEQHLGRKREHYKHKNDGIGDDDDNRRSRSPFNEYHTKLKARTTKQRGTTY